MRNVTITRKKSIFGAWIPYFIFVGYPKTEIDPLDPDDTWDFPESSSIKVSNGQTITFPIQDGRCSIVVWAQTSTGAACGPAYYINEGSTDLDLELRTQYHWLDGSRYIVRPAAPK